MDGIGSLTVWQALDDRTSNLGLVALGGEEAEAASSPNRLRVEQVPDSSAVFSWFGPTAVQPKFTRRVNGPLL